MAPSYYKNFYDPVGSQANQQPPQGYTYSNANANNPPSSTPQYPQQPSYTTSYGTNSYGAQYGSQTYGTAQSQPQQQSTSNSSRAASALNALTPQDFSTSRASNSISQYNNTPTSTWSDSQSYNTSNNNNPAYNQSSKSQANQSPPYPTSSAATFGRLSLPDQSSQTQSSNTFGNSASNASTQSYQNAPSSQSAASQHRQYMTAYTQQQNPQHQNSQHQNPQQPPDRYASPLQAVQAQQRQQTHNRQTSRNSNPQPSPRTAARNLQQQHHQQQQNSHSRQQSTSVEPSPTTVDPSQVYDFRAEQERKARIDAERRKKIDAEKAARKAEEDARQKVLDDRKAEEEARLAEIERVESEREKAEEDARKAEEEACKQQQAKEKKNEQRRKAREEKRQSKTAATALQQMASGAGSSNSANDGQAASMAMMAAMMGDQSQPPANDEEAEMRAMFAKMREFNAKNPALLAKMWEEERTAHATSPAQTTPQAPPPAVAVSVPANTAKRGAGKAQQARQQSKPIPANAAPAQPYQPFTGVNNNTPQNGRPPVPASGNAQQTGGNTSLWPPHKKGSLAEAAAKWLAARPENLNTGFIITREQVLKILDTNPSYVQLCEMIEKTGVKFERSALAKELLKAVPDGIRSATGKPAASPANGISAQMNAAAGPTKRGAKNHYSIPNQGRPTSNGTVSYQSPSFSSLTDAARAINGMPTAPTYPTNSLASALNGGAVQSPNNEMLPFDQQPIHIEDDSTPIPVDIKPEEPRRPPADKEEAARKRTFGDLVDLTGGDDSDDEGPPRKVFQTERPAPIPLPNAVFNPLQRAQQIVQQNFGTQHIGQPGPYNPSMRQNGYSRPPPLPSSTTPSAAPPPPPHQVLKSRGPSQEQLQMERVRGKMLVEPIMRDRVARKSKYDVRTIARDVLLATGRHPDMRPLNAHLNSMQKLLGDHGGVVDGAGNKSDLSTIKWSFIDPGEPAAVAKAKSEAAKKRIEDSDATEDADDEGEQPTRGLTAVTTIRSERSDQPNAAQMRGVAPNANFPVEKKKRGRPKGFRPAFSKKAAAQSASPLNATSTNHDTTSPTRSTHHRRTDSTSTPARARTSPANKNGSPNIMSSGGAVGYAAFREVDANGNVIKKKGRPVGWRKNVHSREAQGLTPAKAGAKPLGSKLRQSTTAASKKEAEPQRREYAVYKCEWKGCKAELDGLERLKKHILKLHGTANEGGDYECWWAGCKNAGKHVDGKGRVRDGEDGAVGTFEDIERWLAHVETVHLEAVGWKLGDGMRGEAYETDSSLYLSDSAGRLLTPIIQPATIPSRPDQHHQQHPQPDDDEEEVSPAKKFDPYGISPLGRSKEELDAGEELAKLRRKILEEGGLLSQEGSKLCNAKRRRGFLDDEEFWDIVEEDSD